MKSKPRFERSTRSRQLKDRIDAVVPLVRVQVAAIDPTKTGAHLIKGNICKSLSIRNAKVGDVFAAIEKALFQGE